MRFILTEHAIERYRDRVRPSLDLPAARDELERLVEMAEHVRTMPEWALDALSEDHAAVQVGDEVLELTADIVMPVHEKRSGVMVGLTVLTRGGMTPFIRAERNRRKAQRRNARLLRSKKAGRQRRQRTD